MRRSMTGSCASRLPDGSYLSEGRPRQTSSADCLLGGDHPMHPFAVDAAGPMYVDVASATNRVS